MIDRTKIYQNSGFMDTLKEAFFQSRKDFGFKYIDEFKTSIEKRPEPELTIPIVALAATGVRLYSVLSMLFVLMIAHSTLQPSRLGNQESLVRRRRSSKENCSMRHSNVMCHTSKV